MCWVLFTRPAGEPGGNHQTNLFQLLNEKQAEQNVPQLKKQRCTRWLFSWEWSFWGRWRAEVWWAQKTTSSNLRALAFLLLGGEMIVLLCHILFSVWSPSALCVCWASTGRVEHWERRPGERKASHLLSPLWRCCLGEGHPVGCRLLGQGLNCFWTHCDWCENIEFSEQVPICPLG